MKGILAILALWATTAQAAQDAGVPGAYLNYVGGPQVTGMGRAFVGFAEGTDAIAWNPAGLGFLRPNIVSFLHTQTVEQSRMEYLSYAQPFYQWGGMGLTYVRLDSGSLPETNQFNQEVGKYSDVQQTAMAAYGMSPMERLSVGGTLKYSRQSLGGTTAQGWGLDIGALKQLNRGFSVGARVQNLIAPALKFESETEQFPRVATLGAASRMLDNRLAVTLDTEKSFGSSSAFNVRTGVEGRLWQLFKLRGGFDFLDKEVTFGFGYTWGRYSFDFSSNSGVQGLSHRFGVSYAFGGYGIEMTAKPASFSPVGLTKKTDLGIRVNHTRTLHAWQVQIKNENGDTVRSIRGSGKPPKKVSWDGKTEYGMMVAAGNYRCLLTVTDKDGRTETTPPQIVHVEYGTPLEAMEVQLR